MTTIVFETHSTTEDNEAGIATGWRPGRLSPTGREQAAALGERRRGDGLSAVFGSDLARTIETIDLAFAGTDVPVLLDWRLRECDYGELNGAPRGRVATDRREYLTNPYPGGESYQDAAARIGRFLDDLAASRWAGQRVLVVGHVATHVGLEHHLLGTPLEEILASEFDWRPGWELSSP